MWRRRESERADNTMDNDILTIPSMNLSTEIQVNYYGKLQREFSQSLLRPLIGQLSAFCHQQYRITYFNKGIVLWWDFPKFAFIEYLLVYREYRRQGFGSSLLNTVKNRGKLVVLEVDPNDSVCSFYVKNGFIMNNHFYSPIQINNVPPPRLCLMTCDRELSLPEYKMFIEIISSEELQF